MSSGTGTADSSLRSSPNTREMSAEMVSKITDKILPEVKEWQSRPLNPVYPFVSVDCIHYKIREGTSAVLPERFSIQSLSV